MTSSRNERILAESSGSLYQLISSRLAYSSAIHPCEVITRYTFHLDDPVLDVGVTQDSVNQIRMVWSQYGVNQVGVNQDDIYQTALHLLPIHLHHPPIHQG